MTADLATLAGALRSQWDRLHGWLELLGDDMYGLADQPSALDGWTNRELVAHLGRAMRPLVDFREAPSGTVPLTLAEYLGTYPERASEIATSTRELADELGPDPLLHVTTVATAGLSRLDALVGSDRLVVEARRGPMLLRELAVSRLIELVVHADDLVVSLAPTVDAVGPQDPRDPEARRIVAEELLRIVVTRGGWSLEVVDALTWVRLATGRVPYDVDTLAHALAPQFTAGGVPDLGRMLPLL